MSCPFAKFATLLAPMTKNSTADQKAQFESIHGFAPPSATFSSQPGKVDLVSAGFTLSEALRVGTAASHRAVEKSKGVSLLLSSLTTSSSSSSSSSSTTTTTTTTLIGEESVAFDRLLHKYLWNKIEKIKMMVVHILDVWLIKMWKMMMQEND
uniref:Related to Heme oxygenase n=1 Tax=Melanopsichium pennsylvanicum 4 TaxID=1398559 RepID=A0A077QQR1_9BASI|nr:related to Heme oxygenase [Melanopsichium pennsylvanicum 4]